MIVTEGLLFATWQTGEWWENWDALSWDSNTYIILFLIVCLLVWIRARGSGVPPKRWLR